MSPGDGRRGLLGRARLSQRDWRRIGMIALLAAASLLCAAVALGRPGGGGSFSAGSSSRGGGSHSSSGGGGLGDILIGLIIDLLFDLLLWLIQYHPAIGVPLVLGFFVLAFAVSAQHRWAIVLSILGLAGVTVAFQKSIPLGYGATLGLLIAGYLYSKFAPDKAGWSTRASDLVEKPGAPPVPVASPVSGALPLPGDRPQGGSNPRATLEKLQRVDPDFSTVLFDDFAYLLFTEVHRARGDRDLARVAPYVNGEAREWLASRPVTAVRDVIIGAMRVVTVGGLGKRSSGSAPITVLLEYEANYTEVNAEGREQAFYTLERWQLARSKEARSRPPEKSAVLPCPACGAPLEVGVGGACVYCKKVVEDGSFAWRLTQVTMVRREERGPVLTSEAAEQGSDLPTIVGPEASARLAKLQERDPSFQMEALARRVDRIFAALQLGWSARDLKEVRPFVSDNLYRSLGYWIEAYRRAKLRNVTENAAVSGVELAEVSTDRYFDAITLRVRASSLDYVLDEEGQQVSGSRDQPRLYTEYWTLIRSVSRQGAAGEAPVCPNCGAPLAINMAGHCEHCQAKVTSGDFDWVLSRIEQDEVYTG